MEEYEIEFFETQKTPQREIALAKKYREEYLSGRERK